MKFPLNVTFLMLLSIVVPTYGAPQRLAALASRIKESVNSITGVDYELILVNDACPQGSWEVILNIIATDPKVKALNLSRNFGQHYAITAGLDVSKGDWVVVMDCDLQDLPEEIPALFNAAQEGYDIIFASREDRQDSAFKKLGSSVFYKILSYATDTHQTSRVANFGIYSRKVIDALLRFNEQLRFLPVNARWLGFKTKELTVSHAAREEGKSSYSLTKLVRLAFDVIFSFSNKPMGMLLKIGFSIAVLSVFVALTFVLRYFFIDVPVQGWTGIMVSLWFMFGCLLFAIGVVGVYVAKAFDEAKQRPIYIVDEILTYNDMNAN
ncbi:glycosyl transferase [Algimonas arctica]|uniref:Glycosyl transferase n=1 Tax=Algimonas arctica TaxID=1479486 RepID=A0A8J3G1B1_9PROT|nr:glycosyltransferase family 2 protein [Algimonas arctica]GHA85363.1 glycosyl transferase [Algimonas arctica]